MVKLRLQRHGTKKRPFYRLVAADQRTKRDGRFIEIVGTYNPTTDPKQVDIKLERVDYWIGNGAQMSPTVRQLVNKYRKNQPTEAASEAASA